MNLLTRDELKMLFDEQEGPFVSIFMPTTRAGAAVQEGPIRLKNLLNQAEEQLAQAELRRPEARQLLEPGRELLEQDDFWQHQNDGLAVFISPNLFRYYRVPLQLEEMMLVSSRFLLKPLMPLLTGDGRFYVLALSQNEIRVLRGSRYSVQEMDLEDIPQSLAETLRFDEFEKQHQFHTNTPPVHQGQQRAAMYHGHGADEDDKDKRLLRYFQQVDKGMMELLQNEQAPLILAGVEYLLPLYQQANSYQHLAEEGVTGNPEELSPKELHQQAWQVVQPYFEQDRQKAVDLYHELVNNSSQASGTLEEVIPAAFYGRVGTLFVALDVQHWGRFDPETATLHLHPSQQPGDEELIDAAAVQTLLNSGKVFAVEPENVPGGGPVAAIFRY